MGTKRIVRISYFTMLTIVGALFHVPFFGTPVDYTLQAVFAVIAGMMLGSIDGALSQLLYLVLGLLGLPVFTKGGGFSYVFQPTFGYLLSLPVAAFLAGKLIGKKSLSPWRSFLCAFAALLLLYAIGIPYQVLIYLFREKYALAAAFKTVPSVLIMLCIDKLVLWLFCLVYPRARSLIGRTDEISA
ncbi:MAG: biotin transporter BioY, partial [Clostridiales bacterium]|nr:biotin transporter BioY [Clostridiales bacterium]